ncbi:MAG: hypothetical protein AYK23_02545 [Candidatus Proteinoplasmatales archaeon SG8-5]|nr:MAG: hypothetical protein AYK23_02545 [Candidatus Proteinoplasmatales archaeon SG8-5]
MGNQLEELDRVLHNNVKEHPERTDATYERVIEVLETVLNEEALATAIMVLEDSMYSNGYSVSEPQGPMTKAQAEIVTGMVMTGLSGGWLSHHALDKMVEMLQLSEISTNEAIALHEAHKIPVSELEKDIIPVKGSGAWMMDTKGKWYLDMDSNYSAANLGLNNPEIAKGLYNQASQLITMKEDRVHIPRSRLIKLLLSIMPQGLDQFYWQNSGGEAVDKALKIAKAYTGQKGVIAFEKGFHGRTHGAVSITANAEYRKPFGLESESWVHFLPYGDLEALEERLALGKEKVVIMELVQGEDGGINVPSKGYVQGVRALTKQHGAVMIADEVQTGFGRTATKAGEWWAADHFEVKPDIMVIGKSFGGGYPVTAVVTTKEVSEKMKPGFDGSTFGGNPMACVAATIAINQMKSLKLEELAAGRGKQLMDGLKALESPLIHKVHGIGLMVGITLPSPGHVKQMQAALKEQGVKTSLSTGAIMRLMPPLVISKQEVDLLVSKFDAAFKTLENKEDGQ